MEGVLRIAIFILLYDALIAVNNVPPFENADSDIFKVHKNSKISAFTDFDSDKTTDIILISTTDKGLQVYYGSDDGSSSKSMQLFNLNDPKNVKTVVPGDFNGDLAEDFLIVHKLVQDNLYRLELCMGRKSTIHFDCFNITENSLGEPMILDADGDMRPDILMENSDGSMSILTMDPSYWSRNFSTQTIDKNLWGSLLPRHSSAFVDLNRDLSADVVLTTTKGLAMPLNQNGVINWQTRSCIIGWPDEVSPPSLGMFSFLDYDSNSYMDIMMTATKDGLTTFYLINGRELTPWLQDDCKGSNKPGWGRLSVSLTDGSNEWMISTSDSWLRAGDVDNDGYVDLLVTLINKENGDVRPFILLNTDSGDGRTFSVQWDWLPVQHNISQVALFDMYSDGSLDILYNTDMAGDSEIHLLKNNIAKQSCFVSVKVGSGLCPNNDESSCSKAYGNIFGPTVQYKSTHPDSSLAEGVATQLTQSTNGALQLPYIQFGLGTTPNFVDSLDVGIVRQKDQVSWKETWKTIIPNSHLVVVPRPPEQPDQWLMHLYVTPSQLVLVTGLVILGLCALVAIIIAILHIKEKYDDHQVKLQESHRFHFNAM